MAEHNVTTAEGLKSFNAEGYKYDAAKSTETLFVYNRPKPAAGTNAAAAAAGKRRVEEARRTASKRKAGDDLEEGRARSKRVKRS